MTDEMARRWSRSYGLPEDLDELNAAALADEAERAAGRDCPEWCDHDGKCADDRAAISAAERYAEDAWARAAEYDPTGEDDREREREMFDLGLQEMRERSGRA